MVNTASIRTATKPISYLYNANVARYAAGNISTNIACPGNVSWRRNLRKLISKIMTRYSGVQKKAVEKETCMKCCVQSVINIIVLIIGFTRKYIFLDLYSHKKVWIYQYWISPISLLAVKYIILKNNK